MQPHQEKTCFFHKRAYGSKIASGFKSIILHSFLLQSNIQYANELFSQLIPLITHLFLFYPNSYLLTRPPSSFPEGHASSRTLSQHPDVNCSSFEIKFAVQVITISQMKYALQKKKNQERIFCCIWKFLYSASSVLTGQQKGTNHYYNPKGFFSRVKPSTLSQHPNNPDFLEQNCPTSNSIFWSFFTLNWGFLMAPWSCQVRQIHTYIP